MVGGKWKRDHHHSFPCLPVQRQIIVPYPYNILLSVWCNPNSNLTLISLFVCLFYLNTVKSTCTHATQPFSCFSASPYNSEEKKKINRK